MIKIALESVLLGDKSNCVSLKGERRVKPEQETARLFSIYSSIATDL